MFTIQRGDDQGLADVRALVDALNEPNRTDPAVPPDFFAPDRPIIIARAPGRLDVMGGIADYSGSLVLEMPTAEATLCALQPRTDRRVHVVSAGAAEASGVREFQVGLDDLDRGHLAGASTARAWFAANPEQTWAGYVLGTLILLFERGHGSRLREGCSLLLRSSVPEGKGVASSAALEVASAMALLDHYGISLAPIEVAHLCQEVENHVVGAPCGLMDQITACCGQRGSLLRLLCQRATIEGTISVPSGWAFWGVDSGIRHAVSGADYTSVRVAAFMGMRIMAELAGFSIHQEGEHVRFGENPWQGYLANVGPALWQEQYADRLPDELSGREFLDRYGGTSDPVTHVDPNRTYAVRQAAAHPIHEHDRAGRFAALLPDVDRRGAAEQLGELMFQSHASYSACSLGSDGTDRLVEMVRKAGPGAGLYGAKITGGGSGGTVAIFGRAEADSAVHDIARRYEQKTERAAHVFSGSSPGAAAFGILRLTPRR